jgi:Holin of 3TMs, for gene-transfer release
VNPLLLPALINLVGQVVGALDPNRKAEAQLKVLELAQQGALAELQAASAAVVAEASGTGIKAWWRPILMLTFGGLIVARFFGWTAPNISPDEYAQLWSILQLGIGGYVVGRSAEKVATSLAGAFKK